jgi:hypothetical protein
MLKDIVGGLFGFAGAGALARGSANAQDGVPICSQIGGACTT